MWPWGLSESSLPLSHQPGAPQPHPHSPAAGLGSQAEQPGTAALWQWGLQEQGTWGAWEHKGPHLLSLFLSLKKKFQNSIDDWVLEGSVALQSFYLLPSYPPC